MDADRLSLSTLVEDIRACRVCRDAPRYGPALSHEPRPVFQVSPSARICIAGQAPGVRVHASGRPYTDPSGVRLRSWLGIGEAFSTILRSSPSWLWVSVSRALTPKAATCLHVVNAPNCGASVCLQLSPIWSSFCSSASTRRNGTLVRNLLAKASVKRSLAGAISIAQRTIRVSSPCLIPLGETTPGLKRNPWFETELLPVLRADIPRIVASTSEAKVADFEAARD
jgi:hypothetical protein